MGIRTLGVLCLPVSLACSSGPSIPDEPEPTMFADSLSEAMALYSETLVVPIPLDKIDGEIAWEGVVDWWIHAPSCHTDGTEGPDLELCIDSLVLGAYDQISGRYELLDDGTLPYRLLSEGPLLEGVGVLTGRTSTASIW